MQNMTLVEIIPRDITPEIYPSIQHFENKVVHNQQETIQVADSALKSLLDSFLTEDQNLCTDQSVKEQEQQVITPHWLPLAAISHAPDQQFEDHMVDTHTIPSQDLMVSVYADLPIQFKSLIKFCT